MINKILKKSILSFVSIVLIFLLAELIINTLSTKIYGLKILTYNPKQSSNFDGVSDWNSLQKYLKCTIPPNTLINGFITNSHGFLSPETSYSNPTKNYRLLFLGDSFGVGVTPYYLNFIRLVETRLNDHQSNINSNSNRFEIINTSINCIGPRIERKILELEGLKYRPNLVILGFYIGNDFIDNYEDIDKIQHDANKGFASYFYQSRVLTIAANLYKILTRSNNLTDLALHKSKKSQVLGVYTGEKIEYYDPYRSTMNEESYLEFVTKSRLPFYQKNTVWYNYLEKVKEDIKHINELSINNNAKLLVLIIPDESQVNSDLLEKALSAANQNKDQIDIFLPQKILKEFLGAHQIEYLDLLPYFLKYSSPKELYQPQDTHLNTFGNKLVADALYPKLLQLINSPD